MTKVYLTKSSEVAYALAHGFGIDLTEKVNGVHHVSVGPADDKDVIPGIYYGKGYFYCAVDQDAQNEVDDNNYKLIVA